MGSFSSSSTGPTAGFARLKQLVKPIVGLTFAISFGALAFLENVLRIAGFQRRRRVLIDCFELFHYHHIRPVVDRLLTDPRLRVFLLESSRFARQVIRPDIAPHKQFVTSPRVRFIPFDLTISTDYGAPHWIPHRGFEIAAPHGGGMKANYNSPERLARYGALWVVGKRQRNNFSQSVASDAVLEDIGFIVTDQLVNNASDKTPVLRRLALDKQLPIVLYAPSYSDKPDLILMSEEILTTLHSHAQFNIIVKPHPLLLRPSMTGGTDYGKMLSRLTNERFKVVTATDVPIQEYMIVSDVLISDISSVVFEFLFLDRPILLQINSRVINYYSGQDYLNDILPAVSIFESAEQLAETLRSALENPKALSFERKRFVEREYFNVGRATDAAVESVYRHLQLPPLKGCNTSGAHRTMNCMRASSP